MSHQRLQLLCVQEVEGWHGDEQHSPAVQSRPRLWDVDEPCVVDGFAPVQAEDRLHRIDLRTLGWREGRERPVGRQGPDESVPLGRACRLAGRR
jgi:hypothetical protein